MIQNEDLQVKADKLIKETNLIRDLSSFGKVKVTGSYSYKLMTKPDIDIYVMNPIVKETAKAILNMVIDKEYFKFVMFQNFIEKTKPHLPFGFYIALSRRIEDVKFNIDVWVVKNLDEYYSKFPNEEIDLIKYLGSGKVTDDERSKILEFKQYKQDNDLPIRSFQIYDAVINKKTKSVDELKNLIIK